VLSSKTSPGTSQAMPVVRSKRRSATDLSLFSCVFIDFVCQLRVALLHSTFLSGVDEKVLL
jgi:hypothetical protein